MTWFSGESEHQSGQFQVGVHEEANGKAGTVTAAEILRCSSLQSGRLLLTARYSSLVMSTHTRNKQSVYAGPRSFERLQIDIERNSTRILWKERYSKNYVLELITSHSI